MRAVRTLLFLLAALGLLAQPSLCGSELVGGDGQITWRDGRSTCVGVALEARSDVLAPEPGDGAEREAEPTTYGAGPAFGPASPRRALPARARATGGEPALDASIVLARAYLRVDGSSNAFGARA